MRGQGDRTRRSSLDRRLLCINRRILQQILRIDTFHDRDGASSRRVTLYEPFVVAATLWSKSENLLSGLPRRTSDLETMGFEVDSDLVGISETLLSLHGIRTSLAEFLTHPDYAGDLYIPPDVYHTQFAEICLDYCDSTVSNMCVEILLFCVVWIFYLSWLRYIERGIGGLTLHIRNGSSIYSAHKQRRGYWRNSWIFGLVHGLPRVCQRRRRKLDR